MTGLADMFGIQRHELWFVPVAVRWQHCDECPSSAVVSVDVITAGECGTHYFCLDCAPDHIRYLAEWGDCDDLTVYAPHSLNNQLAA